MSESYNIVFRLEGVRSPDKEKLMETAKKLMKVLSEAVNLTDENVFEWYVRLDMTVEEAKE